MEQIGHFEQGVLNKARFDLLTDRPVQFHRYIVDQLAPPRETRPVFRRKQWGDVGELLVLPMAKPVLRRKPVWKQWWDCGNPKHQHKTERVAQKCCNKQMRSQ